MTTEQNIEANVVSENKPVSPTHQIHNISLEELEKSIYCREHEKAFKLLFQSLRRLKTGAEFIGYPMDHRLREILYTRMSAAVVALLADPEFNLSAQGAAAMFSEHAIMDMLFRASAFGSSDHLLPQMASNPTESDRSKLRFPDGAKMFKFLTTYSLRSVFRTDLGELFKRNPAISFGLWAGMISHPLTINQQAHERHEHLIGMHAAFTNITMPQEVLQTLSDSYMYTSYATRPDKHDAKAVIHHLCAGLLKSQGVVVPAMPVSMPLTDKPRILVCIEWFTGLHAMYRCYAKLIRQLRPRFEVVALARSFAIDDVGRAEFDHVYDIPIEGAAARDMIKLITEDIKPDMIFYPSLGMEMLFTLLGSVRLAPIQIMSLGHPASSRSPCIDYVVCDEGAIGEGAVFTEKIVTYPNGAARFIMRGDATFPAPVLADHPEVIEVAVPAMLCKLNAPFMAACKRISDQASRKVRFHFFPNTMGLTLHQAAKEIREWLPDALIYERASYNTYLEHLSKCHLHLSTFPFGGTNSVIDSMLLGLPIVSQWGDEPHNRFDGMMQRRAGLPEWTIAKSVDDYVQAALRIVDSDEVRIELRNHLLAFDLQSEFFGEPPEDQRTAFCDAIETIYLTHDRKK